ncbi:hypothetical protein CASFOL_013094 [Castilleja foliolosa]|uniref:Thioredoxin domain-containing protein n=1 Tax=Castilleja foliolosa TaxID=1961234 RepID=A0ABD3DMT2_9LAMI
MIDFAAAHKIGAKTVRSIQKEAKMLGYDRIVPVSNFEYIVESDVELDDSVVVEPDNDPPLEIENPSVDVTAAKKEAAEMLKSRAMDAVLKGKLDIAINHLTEAIASNPKSAILYASRASLFVKLKKPNAAIRDADAALKINVDLVNGYKARGLARAMLGLWEDAYRDLDLVSKFDFDEETSVMLKKVKPNAIKIQLHRDKYNIKRLELELEKIELEKFASMLSDGEVINIKSADEMASKLMAASKTSRLVVIYFTAPWCGACRKVGQLYTRMAKENQKVVFLKVDIEEAMQVGLEWNVSCLPSFYLWKDGETVDKVVDIDLVSLEKKIAELLASVSTGNA